MSFVSKITRTVLALPRNWTPLFSMRGASSQATSNTNRPFGQPISYKESIWQGTKAPEVLKPGEFMPKQATTFQPKMGIASRTKGRKILVCVGMPDWMGSVSALRTAFLVSTSDEDQIVVLNIPKRTTDPNTQLREGHNMVAFVKAIQEITAQQPENLRKKVHMNMTDPTPQPKVELVKKIVAEAVDLVILGNGRYPPTTLGNVASYLALHAPCDVLVVKGGAELTFNASDPPRS